MAGARAALQVDDSAWNLPLPGNRSCSVTENCFYLMQPPENDPDPFWICKVRRKLLFEGRPQVHVQWWEPMTEYKKPHSERDYYRCAYAPAASTPFAMPIIQLPKCGINEGFTAEINVSLTAGGGQFRITKGRKETNINFVKWYVARWSVDSGMQVILIT